MCWLKGRKTNEGDSVGRRGEGRLVGREGSQKVWRGEKGRERGKECYVCVREHIYKWMKGVKNNNDF